MSHFSINFLLVPYCFLVTALFIYFGNSYSLRLLLLFLAGCFIKQTLRRRDGDKDVPFPATVELPLPHSQLRQPLHYSLPGPGGRGAEGTGQKQGHDPGTHVKPEL